MSGVILSVFKVFYVKVTQVQLLVDNRSDSTKMHGATIRFIGKILLSGSTPYPTMGAREVMRRVWDGYRLERPSHCRTELFRVISKCWNADPNKRPDFAALRHDIGALIEASTDGGGYVDLESFAESNKYSYGRSEDHSTLPYHHHHQHHLQSTSAGLGSRITGDDETVTM